MKAKQRESPFEMIVFYREGNGDARSINSTFKMSFHVLAVPLHLENDLAATS